MAPRPKIRINFIVFFIVEIKKVKIKKKNKKESKAPLAPKKRRSIKDRSTGQPYYLDRD